MTIRNSFADIFWFTLFHEIAHIIHSDTKNKFVDIESFSGEIESMANNFAKNALIPLGEFKQFATQEDFSLAAINSFADKCEVSPFIVIGRLMNQGLIGWDCYSNERIRYKWAYHHRVVSRKKIELSLKRIYARDLKAIQCFQISSFFFSSIV